MKTAIIAMVVVLFAACVADVQPATSEAISSVCTIQDQMDGVCAGPATELWEQTQGYADQYGYDPVNRISALCGQEVWRAGKPWTCQLRFDVPFCNFYCQCSTDGTGCWCTCIP